LLRVSETGFHNIAVEWLDDVQHPIEETGLDELGGDFGL
jgi:hypothetical protein